MYVTHTHTHIYIYIYIYIYPVYLSCAWTCFDYFYTKRLFQSRPLWLIGALMFFRIDIRTLPFTQQSHPDSNIAMIESQIIVCFTNRNKGHMWIYLLYMEYISSQIASHVNKSTLNHRWKDVDTLYNQLNALVNHCYNHASASNLKLLLTIHQNRMARSR